MWIPPKTPFLCVLDGCLDMEGVCVRLTTLAPRNGCGTRRYRTESPSTRRLSYRWARWDTELSKARRPGRWYQAGAHRGSEYCCRLCSPCSSHGPLLELKSAAGFDSSTCQHQARNLL